MKTAIALSLLLAAAASAQDMANCPMHAQHAKEATPHLKAAALSEQQVADYLAGAGMGLGKSGEMNGYPGPKHVLELADKLALTPEQQEKIEASRKRMQKAAARLGEEIVAKERELDRLFVSGSIDERALGAMTEEIARLQGRLRAVHLMAHLEAKQILTEEQIAKYRTERGHAGHH